MVRDMEKQGVVRPSCSPWASPVVLVLKKDGTKRFCVDYRKLNGIRRKDGYPLPRIDDILDTLGGSQYFTSLDLASGYWQVGMDEESVQKSAFITHSGLYEFVRMPFGMCNAPATFQRLMEIVLSDLLWKHCFAYLDDILVCSPTFDDHLHHLHTVFERIRQAGLRLQAKKCQFLKPSVCYRGHVVSKEGICPDPAKTNQIEHYPVPTDVEGVRRFLGLASYYRRFVSEFSKVASPLHLLLKKGVPFSWTVECQHSFESLKRKLVSAPVLSYPSFKSHEPFILEIDASGRGLGAVLAQKQHDGLVHPITFASRALSSHERNYSITELETLAVVWAAKLFRPYLLGHACKVITDHSACTSLLNSANPSSKLARWAMVIQELDLTITHHSGKSNRVADAISRSPVSPVEVLQVETTSVDTSTPPAESDIVKLQRHDEEFAITLQFLENGNVPEDQRLAQYLKVEQPNFEVIDGLLCYHHPLTPECIRIAVPRCLRATLMKEAHGGKFAGQFAERKVYLTLRGRYWWKGMRSDVRRYCRSCLVCASRKGPGRRQCAELCPIPVGGPFHTVGVDVLQLPRTFDGNQYAVVFVNYLTKWPEVFAVPDQKAETIARLFVEGIVSRHGVPELLLSDRGPNFLSSLVLRVCELMGTSKINTSGYHPQCDGLVEKFNSTIISMLSKTVEKHGRDWDRNLPYILFAYREAVQDSTKISPFYLLYGHRPLLPMDAALSQPRSVYRVDFEDYADELASNLSEAWKLAHDNCDIVTILVLCCVWSFDLGYCINCY